MFAFFKNKKKGVLLISVLLILLVLTILLTSLIVQVRIQNFYTTTEKVDLNLKNLSYSVEDFVNAAVSSDFLFASAKENDKSDGDSVVSDGAVINLQPISLSSGAGSTGFVSVSNWYISEIGDFLSSSNNDMAVYKFSNTSHLILAFKKGNTVSVVWFVNRKYLDNKKPTSVNNITLNMSRIRIKFARLYCSYNNLSSSDYFDLGQGRVVPANSFRLKVNTTFLINNGVRRYFYTDSLYAKDLILSSSLNSGGTSSLSASGNIVFSTLDPLGRNKMSVGEFSLGGGATVDLDNPTDTSKNHFAFGTIERNNYNISSGNVNILNAPIDETLADSDYVNGKPTYSSSSEKRISFSSLVDKGKSYSGTLDKMPQNVKTDLANKVGMQVGSTSPNSLKIAKQLIESKKDEYVNYLKDNSAPVLPEGAYIMVAPDRAVFIPDNSRLSISEKDIFNRADLDKNGNFVGIGRGKYYRNDKGDLKDVKKDEIVIDINKDGHIQENEVLSPQDGKLSVLQNPNSEDNSNPNASGIVYIKQKIQDDVGGSGDIVKLNRYNFEFVQNAIVGSTNSSYFYFSSCPNIEDVIAHVTSSGESVVLFNGGALVKGALAGDGTFIVDGDGTSISANNSSIKFTDSNNTIKDFRSGDIATEPESQLVSSSQDITLFAKGDVYMTPIEQSSAPSQNDPFIAQVIKWGLISYVDKNNSGNLQANSTLPNNLEDDNVEDLNKWNDIDSNDKNKILSGLGKLKLNSINITGNPSNSFSGGIVLNFTDGSNNPTIITFSIGGVNYTMTVSGSITYEGATGIVSSSTLNVKLQANSTTILSKSYSPNDIDGYTVASLYGIATKNSNYLTLDVLLGTYLNLKTNSSLVNFSNFDVTKFFDNSGVKSVLFNNVSEAYSQFQKNKKKFAKDIGARRKDVRFISIDEKNGLKASYIAGTKKNGDEVSTAGYLAYLPGVGDSTASFKDAKLGGLIYGRNFVGNLQNNNFSILGSLFFAGGFQLNGVNNAQFVFDPKYLSSFYGTNGNIKRVLHIESVY